MSLYEGLDLDDHPGLVPSLPPMPPEKPLDPPKNPGWSGTSLKFLESQKHLQAKKAASLNSLKRKSLGTTLAPVINLRRRGTTAPATPGQGEGGVRFNPHTGKMEVPLAAGHSPFLASEAPTSFPGITDEYDPFHPNDYEEVVTRKKEQRQRARDEEKKREADERRSRRGGDNYDSDSEGEFEKRQRRREEKEEEGDKPRRPGGGAAIAPPPSLIEDTKPIEPVEIPPPPSLSDPSPGPGFSLDSESVASKIMAKMGYRQGSGLGKSEQGMSTALQVEKTSKRGGKIIHEKDIPKVTEMPRPEVSNANLLKNPSKVILLRNMVGPGEVDDDLEPETAEECAKYGKVIKCVIFEIPGVVEEEAVRIFLQFERMEAAIKAVVDLNGRFFGGRAVKAGFYNVDKFRQLDLAEAID